jgi:glycosyltransferase involved in cell wall biosynthesis
MGFVHGVAGMPLSRQRFLQKNVVKYIQQAKKVIVLSHTLKQDVLEYAPAARDKLTLLRPAVDKSYQPLAWEDREDVKQTFAGGVEYFIAVGSMHPKNNLMPLLKAFSALKRRLHSNMKLVLVGAETTAGNDIAGSLPSYKFRNDVVWIQDASQETLAQLIAGAYALIYSSRFAGIAMPVYAAMECEVPVIALESAIAREAGEDAVLYTDPDNLEDLADKMCLLYKDEDLRSRLLGKARKAIPGDAPELLIID